MFIVYFVGTAI